MSLKACLNCGQESDADYCPACGQSMDVKISTAWHFINETLDVIYNFDSKIWKSLLPLLFQPGKLTNEYIAGRRVRYLPPFRLYLIFSILFFLIAAIPDFTGFDELSPEDREELAQDLEESRLALNDLIEEGSEQISQNLQESGLALNDLIQESIGQRDLNQQDPELVNDEENIGLNSVFLPPTGFPEGAAPPEPLEIGLGGDPITTAEDCVNVPWQEFIGERLGARARNACQEVFSDNGVTLMQSFIDAMPIMMFVSLPLLAVFMKLLYLFKNRKYVEHLMFLFHTLSFFFLVVILNISIIKLSGPFPVLESSIAPFVSMLWIYAVIYLFIALRKVYQQNFFMTSFKMIMLFPSYSICLAISFVSGLFFTFITI